MTSKQGGGSGGGGWILVVSLGLALAWCHNRGGESTSSASATSARTPVAQAEEDGGESQTASLDDSGEEKGGETYGEYDARRDQLATGLYSGGDECTEDCGGHDAGRDWAESRGINNPDDCGGKSWSFEEGCRSYAQEQQQEEQLAEETY